MKKYTTRAHEETIALGKDIAKNLKNGSIVLLYGDLGAGKTTFVKGVAQGFGVKVEVTSPTFTLMNVYPTNGERGIDSLCHIDTYRLRSFDEFVGIGALEYVADVSSVSVIEWPEKVADKLANVPTNMMIHVRMRACADGTREIEVEIPYL